jgi:hypothetical protein
MVVSDVRVVKAKVKAKAILRFCCARMTKVRGGMSKRAAEGQQKVAHQSNTEERRKMES